MRVLDMVHGWAAGTHTTYQGKLRHISLFEQRFGVTILPGLVPPSPPAHPSIPLAWCQELHSLRSGASRLSFDGGVSYTTVRQLRSAVSQYLAIHSLHLHPSSYLDGNRRLLYASCRDTDNLGSTLFSQGLASRIGTAASPSVALLHRHIISMVFHLEAQVRSSSGPVSTQASLAICAHLLLWLGWLRSTELFSLRWRDITIIPPASGPSVGLPPGIGVVLLQLLPETKSSRSKTADIVIAYTTLSGLKLGYWLRHAAALCPASPDSLIFLTPSGHPWDSAFFRHHFLYPGLRRLQREGDPFLLAFNGPSGNTLEDKFWALHSYRRGARSHVSKRHLQSARRAASPTQVYEHARWRLRRSSERIDLHYQEWTIPDRIRLTLYFM